MTNPVPILPCYVSSDRPVFSAAECEAIIALGKRQPMLEGVVQSRKTGQGAALEASQNRDSQVVFFERDAETEWVYRRIMETIKASNDRFWHFRIDGLEKAQFARYGPDQHYDWHIDLATQGPAMFRKLSLTVQLSDPADYRGGDLEFKLSRDSEIAARERGTVTIFPSYVLHRVRPVTEGQRHSLVQWVLGKTPLC